MVRPHPEQAVQGRHSSVIELPKRTQRRQFQSGENRSNAHLSQQIGVLTVESLFCRWEAVKADTLGAVQQHKAQKCFGDRESLFAAGGCMSGRIAAPPGQQSHLRTT